MNESRHILLFFRNRKFLFLKCCPGIINYCLNICRLKNSTPPTPKRAERARYLAQEQEKERDKPNFEKNVGKPHQFVK